MNNSKASLATTRRAQRGTDFARFQGVRSHRIFLTESRLHTPRMGSSALNGRSAPLPSLTKLEGPWRGPGLRQPRRARQRMRAVEGLNVPPRGGFQRRKAVSRVKLSPSPQDAEAHLPGKGLGPALPTRPTRGNAPGCGFRGPSLRGRPGWWRRPERVTLRPRRVELLVTGRSQSRPPTRPPTAPSSAPFSVQTNLGSRSRKRSVHAWSRVSKRVPPARIELAHAV